MIAFFQGQVKKLGTDDPAIHKESDPGRRRSDQFRRAEEACNLQRIVLKKHRQ